MPDGFAEPGGGFTGARVDGADGEEGDFVVEVYESFNNNATALDTPAGLGVIPGCGNIIVIADNGLAFAGGTHHGFDHTGEAHGGDGLFEFEGVGGEGVCGGRESEFFRGETPDSFAVHGQLCGTGGGDDGNAVGFTVVEHIGVHRLDFGDDELRFDLGNESPQFVGVGHVDHVMRVRNLVRGRIFVAIHRVYFHAETLKGNGHFFTEFT